MTMAWLLVALILLLSNDMRSDSARILAVFPYPSHSHSIVLHTVTTELARRGHDLVVFTSDPVRADVPPTYKQIDLSSFHEFKKKWTLPPMGTCDPTRAIEVLETIGNILTKEVFSHPEMSKLIEPNSTAKFDLVIVEWMFWLGSASLSHRFSAPLIGITTMRLNIYSYYSIGNPLAPAYIPDYNLPFTDQMSLWQRIVNLYYGWKQIYKHEHHLERQDAIVRKYLPKDTPHLRDIYKNVSMLFSYSDPITFYPQPNVPALVEIGGLITSRQKKFVQLPVKLQSFLDEATDGFIYFSFGSTIPSKHMSEWTRSQFVKLFAELPYRVLWKWENETLPDKPSNVFISKWLPQRQILSHPNILAFIYQGGLQSTEEAIASAVPVVGIPLFVDQQMNIKKMESAGLGKGIYTEIKSIRKSEIRDALMEVINDPRYKQRIKDFRDVAKDQPQDMLDKIAWWTEYVIRHKGAKHLRVRAVDMPWYQLHCVDIAVILLFAAFLACIIFCNLASWVVRKFLILHFSRSCKTKIE